MWHSVCNHKPNKRMNLATIQTALQTAIIATATTLFPTTTQFVNFPIVFENSPILRRPGTVVLPDKDELT